MLANHNLPIEIGDTIYWNNYNFYGTVIDFIAVGYYKVVDFDQIHIWYQVVIKNNNDTIEYLTGHDGICAYSKSDGNIVEDDFTQYDWHIGRYGKYSDGEYKVKLVDGNEYVINSCHYKLNNHKYGYERKDNSLPLDYDFEYKKFATNQRVILESEIVSVEKIMKS